MNESAKIVPESIKKEEICKKEDLILPEKPTKKPKNNEEEIKILLSTLQIIF